MEFTNLHHNKIRNCCTRIPAIKCTNEYVAYEQRIFNEEESESSMIPIRASVNSEDLYLIVAAPS